MAKNVCLIGSQNIHFINQIFLVRSVNVFSINSEQKLHCWMHKYTSTQLLHLPNK